jgi:hypothetical protein
LVAVAAWASPTSAQTTRPADDPRTVDDPWAAWIDALGAHAPFATRENAQRDLTEAGEDALPSLRAALSSGHDEERRTRVEAILKRIAEDTVIGPTRLSLDLRDVPIERAIDAINEQARGHVTVLFPRELVAANRESEADGPRVTLLARRQPLWSVLGRLCEQADLELSPSDDGVRLAPACGAPRGLAAGPTAVAGPLLVAAARVYHQRSVEFMQGGTRTSDFGVQLNVLAEPKLRILPGAASLRLAVAEDDAGRSLLLDAGQDETYGGGAPYWTFSARLRYPDDRLAPGRPAAPPVRIRRLAGTVTFVAATRFETVDVTDLASAGNVAVEAGGCVYVLRRVHQSGGRYEVSLAAAAPPGDAEAIARLQQTLYTAPVRLLDDRGRPLLRSAGPNFVASDRPHELELTVTFDRNLSDGRPAPGPACRLLWQIPAESRPISLPFELRDLPLP